MHNSISYGLSSTYSFFSVIRTYIFTFRKTDKKGIAALYDLLNVRKTLFPLTRSCEGTAKETNFFDYQCGKCWWCKERIYGFGSLE